MPFSQTDVDGLKAAMAAAGNAQDVSYSDGTRIRYLPIAEAKTLLQMMEADVRATTPVAPNTIQTRAFRGVLGSGY